MKIPKPNPMEPSMKIYFDSFLGFGMQTNKLFSWKVLVMHELTKKKAGIQIQYLLFGCCGCANFSYDANIYDI